MTKRIYRLTKKRGGWKLSEETKRKIGLNGFHKGMLGKKHTAESIKKMSETRKKNGSGKWSLGRKLTEEHKKKISEGGKGKKHHFKEGYVGNKGKHWKLSEETKKRISEGHKGEKAYQWLGGISYEPYSQDWTKELKTKIRKRDKFTCKICNNKGFTVHHIDYNKKNCKQENLITLCSSCHSKTNGHRDYWINYFKKL